MKLARILRSPVAIKVKAEEKRRRLSFLKGKYQGSYKPSEARAPRPPKPRMTFKQASRTAQTVLTKISQQASRMPSNADMDSYVWGGNGKKKKS